MGIRSMVCSMAVDADDPLVTSSGRRRRSDLGLSKTEEGCGGPRPESKLPDLKKDDQELNNSLNPCSQLRTKLNQTQNHAYSRATRKLVFNAGVHCSDRPIRSDAVHSDC